jgi:hypothetical protein
VRSRGWPIGTAVLDGTPRSRRLLVAFRDGHLGQPAPVQSLEKTLPVSDLERIH